MATRNFIAIDLGAESGRTVVGRFDGEKLDLFETHRFPNGGVRVLDTLFWDVLGLWREIKMGIGRSIASEPVASLGVDTWGIDYGLLDADGLLIGNPIHYRDRRTDGMMEAAFQRVPKTEIHECTGIQFMKLNTLYQLLAAARRATGDPFARAKTLLFMPDLFNFFLTGSRGAEYTIASTSQMLDARSRDWARSLLERLDLPTQILPPLVATGTDLGTMLPSVAAETNGGSVRVIATAGHDTAAAVAAVPGKGDGWCYISSGTWSLMGVELDRPVINERTLDENFTNEGGVNGTIRFLKNIMGLWLVQECKRSFERAGRRYDYEQLTSAAAAAPPFGAVVDPDDDGFIQPDDMPSAIRAFCERSGQRAPATDEAIVRCCLESLVLRYRKTLEQLENITGKSYQTIHIVGGGSRNALLCQWTADGTGRQVIAGPVEATAVGNCLVQAMALGDVRDLGQARELVRRSFPVTSFEPRPDPRWDERYEKFQSLLRP